MYFWSGERALVFEEFSLKDLFNILVKKSLKIR